MFEPFQFEGHIEGNHIVPNRELNLPENAKVKVSVEMAGEKEAHPIQLGKQDLSQIIGMIKAKGPFQVGNLSREEIYRDDL